MTVTLANMRGLGCRDLIVYCGNAPRCWHSTRISDDAWPDDVALADIAAHFVCTACGAVGADVRPDYSGHTSPARPAAFTAGLI